MRITDVLQSWMPFLWLSGVSFLLGAGVSLLVTLRITALIYGSRLRQLEEEKKSGSPVFHVHTLGEGVALLHNIQQPIGFRGGAWNPITKPPTAGSGMSTEMSSPSFINDYEEYIEDF